MDIESVKLFIFEALDICHNNSCCTCPKWTDCIKVFGHDIVTDKILELAKKCQNIL